MRFKYLALIPLMGAAVLAGPAQAQAAKGFTETPQGVVTPDGHLIGKAKLIHRYAIHQPSPAAGDAQSERARNRATVEHYFEIPVGDERARLFADDGVKEAVSTGLRWEGMDANLQSNRDSAAFFPGWKWSNTTVWDTQDPNVFWVEADGSTTPPPGKEAFAGHYLIQVVLKGGKIVLYREFAPAVKLAK